MSRQTVRFFTVNALYALIAIALFSTNTMLGPSLSKMFPLWLPGAWPYISMGLELLCFVVPGVLFSRFSKHSQTLPKRMLLTSPGKAIWLVAPLVIIGYILTAGLQSMWVGLFSLLGANVRAVSAISSDMPLAVSVLAVAVTPAICEEVFFRSAMQPLYQINMRPWQAIIIVGALFGLMHGQIYALPGHLFLGIMMSALVYFTGSVWTSMLYHLLHNFISVMATHFLQYLYDLLPPLTNAASTSQQADWSPGTMLFVGYLISMFFGCIAFGLMALIRRVSYKARPQLAARALTPRPTPDFITFVPLYIALVIVGMGYGMTLMQCFTP